MNNGSRRSFLKTGAALIAGGSGAVALAGAGAPAPAAPEAGNPLAGLPDMARDARLITAQERKQRRDKLRATMRKLGHDAVLIEPGTTLEYFTNVKWWISERLTAVLIPAEGDMMFVTPSFEESRLRELLETTADVLTWEEDQDPFALIGAWLKRKGLAKGTVALDESVRHFVAHELAAAAPDVTVTSARPEVTRCRVIKSAAEIALMQLASDITIRAYRTVYPMIERGMGREDIVRLMYQAQAQLGADSPAGGAQIGKGSALPHGSTIPEFVDDGVVVLMDFGCSVGGYRSDISRTFVFGEADAHQVAVWNHVRKGQEIAFATAQPGTPAGEVDVAVRRYYEKAGYGPDYRLPGLSHRTGHGIGMDVHEPINFVRNEQTPLAPGMCLSNEPGIYIPGRYGVRLEDCVYITEQGPRWFSQPPPSIEQPMA
ncbi:M24 family metallopeptidase [Parahaliea aestuarii]|uniref:Aminopeptidase P family protein n=1 Tax=Parahaliea aestuarii TaxID=1852021 RepID=A0A5C9A5B4_9GAMM|nr:Xaa-Pro peptidase family protein [Parahaliea aestuarii]TXS94930.1 aminopeptidase P family protein [Parahaliea aestuarii]